MSNIGKNSRRQGGQDHRLEGSEAYVISSGEYLSRQLGWILELQFWQVMYLAWVKTFFEQILQVFGVIGITGSWYGGQGMEGVGGEIGVRGLG